MLTQWLSSAWRRAVFVAVLVVMLMSAMPMKASALSSSQLIALTNNQRTSNGLAPLAYDGRLASSAAAKARHMIANDYWAHTAPDGTSPWTFVRQAGYPYVSVGENLAKGFSADSSVISAWMASPSHRANILNAKFRHIGIAVASGVIAGKQTTIVVAHYGATTAESATASAPAPAPKASASKPAAPKPSPKPAVRPAPAQQSKPIPAPVPAPAAAVKAAVEPPKNPEKHPSRLLLERLAALIDDADSGKQKLALR